MEVLESSHFGLFVFAPDDITRIRDQNLSTVRDNVIFELGLFIGKLGRERCFIITPRLDSTFHLPTDLLGITPGTYEPNRQDNNLVASLGPACNRIRKTASKAIQMEKEGKAPSPEEFDDNDIISIIESWLGSRDICLNTAAIRYDLVDQELSLPVGSAKKFLKIAAQRWSYIVHREGMFSPSDEITQRFNL